MRSILSLRRGPGALLAASLVLGLAGCGPRLYPVHGSVTLEDGKPLSRGLLLCEGASQGAPVMARGEIQPDGSFHLSTFKPGDGAFPGAYRVLVNPMDLSDVPDEKKNLPFDVKYLHYETSGLTFEVQAGRNEFPIKLSKSIRASR